MVNEAHKERRGCTPSTVVYTRSISKEKTVAVGGGVQNKERKTTRAASVYTVISPFTPLRLYTPTDIIISIGFLCPGTTMSHQI